MAAIDVREPVISYKENGKKSPDGQAKLIRAWQPAHAYEIKNEEKNALAVLVL